MASLTFINYRDDHGKNQVRIKRHAAKTRYAKARIIASAAHQRQKFQHNIPVNADLLSQSESTLELPMARLRSCNSPILNIDPPDDFKRTELVLSQASHWMVGRFQQSWRTSIERDPAVFDFDHGVEMIRESFFVVADLISIGKTKFAFDALNYLLDMMPKLLKELHPLLFFFFVELAAGISLRDLPQVHSKVKDHVSNLSGIVLGDKHPITTLLKPNLGHGSEHVAELVFACILDTLYNTFGHESYQTLCQQFGRSQFYSSTGRNHLARHLLLEIRRKWSRRYGHDSAIASITEYELSKIIEKDSMGNEGQATQPEEVNAMLRVEGALGMYGNRFNAQAATFPNLQHRSASSILLARHLLTKKRYSLAFHVYTRDILELPTSSQQLQTHLFGDTVARIVEAAMK